MKNSELFDCFQAISNLDKRELNNEKIKLLRRTRLIVKEKLDEFNELRKEIFARYDIINDEDISKLKVSDQPKHDKCIKEIEAVDKEISDIKTEPFLKEYEVLNVSKNFNEFIVDTLIEVLAIPKE